MGAYFDAVMALAPRHYWRLNEPQGGVFFDLGAVQVPLVGFGGFYPGFSGVDATGGSVFFNGSNGTLRFTTNGNYEPAPFTVSAMFYVQSFQSGFQGVIYGNNIDTPGAGPEMYLSTGLLPKFSHGIGGNTYSTITGASPVVTNVWHQMVMSLDSGNNMRLYIDSALVAGPLAITPVAPNTTIHVGSYQGSANFLNGFVSEVAVYPAPISLAGIQNLYSKADLSTFPIPQAPLPNSQNLQLLQSINTGVAELSTDIDLILAAVRRTFPTT